MHVVVNHLHLRDLVEDAPVEAAQEAVQRVVDAGPLAAHVAKVDDRHLILIPEFASPGGADRVSREIGRPWMRERIVTLLA